ncbi:MAG TPA: hypothetical protein VEY93_12860, partial [Longimicrobium sp.]|nr:hypothetical protein [Longimicrobium sp.]
VWGAPSLDRPDTLKRAGTGWVRLVGGGVRVHFDATGRHDSTVSRLKHQTAFRYDSAGRLETITIPQAAAAQGFAFRYGADRRLDRVESPGIGGVARVTTIHRAGPRVDSIADPDLSRIRFGYADATSLRVASRTNRLGHQAVFRYDGGYRLSASRLDPSATDSIVTRLRSMESLGLATSTGGGAVDSARAYALLDGPRTDVGDSTRLWLDRWGAPRRIVNALGHQTVLFREDPRFPALVTRTRAPNGLETSAAYDARGNVEASTVHNPLGDGRHARTTYEWDAKWDAPTRISTFEVSAAGVARQVVGSTRMEYDSVTGNRLWEQLGDSVARRVTYSYYPAGHPHAGQIARIRTPADVAHGVPGDSVAYDASGNLQAQATTTGILTSYVNDVLGRPVVTVTPVDAAKGLFRRDSVVYDAMGRVTWSISTGPALTNPEASSATGVPSTTPEQRLFVHNSYDDAGNLLAVRRWSVPDTAHVDVMTTQFEYDRAGRKRAEIAADGARDSTYYDAAGNVTTAVTRRGYRITMTYDELNRLRTRAVPPTATRGRDTLQIGYGVTVLFPIWGTDPATGNATVRGATVTFPGDTERFAYDRSGNLIYAANRDAIVRRRYNPNGTLAGDTLIIATYATRDTTQHVYGLRYQYDVLGRRMELHHPTNLAPAGGWTVHNEYDPLTGALAGVTDPAGTHSFHHNTAGQLTGETFANGVTEAYTHDAEGRLRTRTLTIPGMGVLDRDTMTYDPRGKLTHVQQRLGGVQNFYSGLGTLAWSRSTENNYDFVEQAYARDALGNTAVAEKYDYAKRDNPKVEITKHAYDALTARLKFLRVSAGWGADATSGGNMAYDIAGNNTFASDGRPHHSIPDAYRVEGKGSYYDAADRLRMVDMQACAWTDSVTAAKRFLFVVYNPGSTVKRCVGLHTGDGSAFEEYRYDALGRRVLVRTRHACVDSGCIENVTRTVWDGDRVLWEVRAPGSHPERDVVPPGELPAYNIGTGRVAYTFGSALDHPLAVHRFEYRDSLF